MRPRELSYRCNVCGWQGQLEPLDAGDASPCPTCGVFLYPRSWGETWGVTLAILGGAVVAVAAGAYLMR